MSPTQASEEAPNDEPQTDAAPCGSVVSNVDAPTTPAFAVPQGARLMHRKHCKQSRGKRRGACDGKEPCGRCTARGLACEYGWNPNGVQRISTTSTTEHGQNTLPDHPQEPSCNQTPESLPSQSPSAVSDATHTDAETQLNPSTSIPLTKYRPLYGRNEESYIDDAGWIYTFGAPDLTSSNGHLAFRLRLPSSLARDVPSGAVTEGGDAS